MIGVPPRSLCDQRAAHLDRLPDDFPEVHALQPAIDVAAREAADPAHGFDAVADELLDRREPPVEALRARARER